VRESELKKVRVAHIRDSCGMYGAERVILTLARHIYRPEFDVTLIALKGPEGQSEKFIQNAIAMGINVQPVYVRGRLDFKALLEVRKILRKQSIQILHSHDFKSNFYGLTASTGMPISRVVTAHGSTRDSFMKRAYLFMDERMSYRFFGRIIAVSERLRGELSQRGVSWKKIEVIPNAIDLSLIVGNPEVFGKIERKPRYGERYVFGVVGRLYPDKGHRFFLEAFARLAKDYHFVSAMIVGDGPERTEILHMVAHLGLSEKVDLCGERDDMEVVYQGLNAVVIPSLREGLPYVLLESLALKIPVIATAVGDIPVLIRNGETGFIVPPGDADAIEKRMREFIASPEKAQQMADRGCDAVKKHCSPRKMIERLESVYRQAITNGKRSAS
jgi:glycosyltransferase involved in cell wall biosynthesis